MPDKRYLIHNGFCDITKPEDVEIHIRCDGKVIWININGECVLRCCRIQELILIDEREYARSVPADCNSSST